MVIRKPGQVGETLDAKPGRVTVQPEQPAPPATSPKK